MKRAEDDGDLSSQIFARARRDALPPPLLAGPAHAVRVLTLLSASNKAGATPLHLAAIMGFPRFVAFFLRVESDAVAVLRASGVDCAGCSAECFVHTALTRRRTALRNHTPLHSALLGLAQVAVAYNKADTSRTGERERERLLYCRGCLLLVLTFVFDICVFVIADAGVLSSFAHMAVSESGGGAARRAAGAAEVAAKNRIGCALHALKQALDAIALIASSDQHVRICVFESFIYAFLLTFLFLCCLGRLRGRSCFHQGGRRKASQVLHHGRCWSGWLNRPLGGDCWLQDALPVLQVRRADFVFSLLDD